MPRAHTPRHPPPPPPSKNRSNWKWASGGDELSSIPAREVMSCPPPPWRSNRTATEFADSGGGHQSIDNPSEDLHCPPPPPPSKRRRTDVQATSILDGEGTTCPPPPPPPRRGNRTASQLADAVCLPPVPSKGASMTAESTDGDLEMQTMRSHDAEDAACPTPPPPPRRSYEDGVDFMDIQDKEDMAFVCGKGGSTVRRIGRAAGCIVELFNERMQMEVRGTYQQRQRALKYARFMIAQRKAKKDAVLLQKNDISDDCTVMEIPKDAMSYVLGIRGATLRTMEQQHNVIMFVCHVSGSWFSDDVESLCILGDRSGRRNAQLEVMSSVESTSNPGYYTGAWEENGEMFEQQSDCFDDWGSSAIEITEAEKRFLVGAAGRTRKSIAEASNCVVQSVGNVVFLSGTEEQRSHSKDYVLLTLSQISDQFVPHAKQLFVEERDDRTMLEIPTRDVGYITGRGRDTLNVLEEQFGVLMVFCETIGSSTYEELSGTKTLAIFGPVRARTYAEVEIKSSVEANDPGTFTAGSGEAKRSVVEGIAVDCIPFENQRQVGYIIGKEGTTLKRLSKASGAFVQFVGHILHIAGDFADRSRARDYVGFHQQIEKQNCEPHISVSGRSDVTIVITEGLNLSGADMWKIESESGTFCMNALDDEGVQQFFIFGADAGDMNAPWHMVSGRAKAEKMAIAIIRDKRKQLRISQAHVVHVRRSPFSL